MPSMPEGLVPRVPVRLDISKILEILPHRYPFVMVDRVVDLIPGEWALGIKMVSYGEAWCTGHYPGRPILPGVLILEALTQLGAILAYATSPFDPSKSMLYLLGMDAVKFRHPVVPGDQLDLTVEILQQHSNTWRLRGEALVKETLCAQAEFTASVVDREP